MLTGRRLVRVLGACLALFATPAVAHAHLALAGSSPAAGVRLQNAPRELRLWFTESPELTFTTVHLRSQYGVSIVLGDPQFDGSSRQSIVIAVEGILAAGAYTVEWKTAGIDGHPVVGRFEFFVESQALSPSGVQIDSGTATSVEVKPTTQTERLVESTPMEFDAQSPGYVGVRAVLYAGMLTVIGSVTFHLIVLGFVRKKFGAASPILVAVGNRAASVGLAGSALVAVAVIARLFSQSYAMHAAADWLDLSRIGLMLTSTRWGQVWLLQVACVVLVIAGFARARRGGRTSWIFLVVASLALAFTPALSGHAAAASRLGNVAVFADAIHIVGAGGWLGSLLVLVLLGIPSALRLDAAERNCAVSTLVHAFSPTALVFAGLTATTGVFAAWLHLDGWATLWLTPYGRTLVLKLAILSVVAGTGAYNWRRVKPMLGSDAGVTRLRQSARVELAVGVLVILVTAALVATPTPAEGARGHSMNVGIGSARP